jgi:hypothetical protein
MSLYNLKTFKPFVPAKEYYRVGDTVRIKNLQGDDIFECFNKWQPFYLNEINMQSNSFGRKIEYLFENDYLTMYIRISTENTNYKIVRSKNILIEKKRLIVR